MLYRDELHHKKALCLQFFKSICTKLCTYFSLRYLSKIKKHPKRVLDNYTNVYYNISEIRHTK